MVVVIIILLAAANPRAEEARVAYEKALRYVEAKEYAAALPHFETAYELSGHRPSTILGLAQCERELELYDRAITHFKEYVATQPVPPDSKKIEKTIALLEQIRAEQKTRIVEAPKREEPKREEAPPLVVQEPPPTPPPEEDAFYESPLVWIVAGVVVIGGGVALGFALDSDPEPYGGSTMSVLRKLEP